MINHLLGNVHNINKTQQPMREVHASHVIPSFWYRIERDPIRSKFLVPEKSGTRMHDTRAKFLVRDSGTSSGAENLGRVPSALEFLSELHDF